MTTSERAPATPPKQCYVWIWLPGATEPVVASRLGAEGERLLFNYGRSYLARPDAIAIFERELPLRPGLLEPGPGLSAPGCIRDAAPDAWGRRVIINRLTGARRAEIDPAALPELTYLLKSGSDRIGMLDFQRSPSIYEPRLSGEASLEDLMDAANRVDLGVPLSPEIGQALFHGSSIGGARPKALLQDGGRKLIAKFTASGDVYSVVKAEFVAMRLAAAVGLNVARVELARAAGKDVLLIERFDRQRSGEGWTRRGLISALTLLELDEMMARYASYSDLAEIIRHRFAEPRASLHELYGRIVFNILCGNTDDHARNHAAFWDGAALRLTPAYDICPQARAGGEAGQAMLIQGEDRTSRIATCLDAAHLFQLDRDRARAIAALQIETLGAAWESVCAAASMGEADRRLLWGRQFLNPFAFEGLAGDDAPLADLAERVRSGL